MSYMISAIIGAAVFGGAIRTMLSFTYLKVRKEAESMGKSTHPLMKTLMKRFHTSYELKLRIQNVDIYVEKYLRNYKKAGISLGAWETWSEVFFAVSVLGCIAVNAYLIWTNASVQWQNGAEWSKMTVFCSTLIPCVVLYLQDMILNIPEHRKQVKVEIVDYLENVCQPRLENDMFHKKEMEEYQKEYFDQERKQLDQLLQPEQIRFTKEEQQVIEEVLREYMV